MVEFLYHCVTCGKIRAPETVRYLCPDCAFGYHPGRPLIGVLRAEFDYAAIGRQFDLAKPDWSLFSAVDPAFFPPYAMSPTPFGPARGLGAELGFADVWIKNDGLNPSGSLKDRASFLVVAESNRLKEDTVVTASTGNAASALAAVCAAAGKRALIFVPQTAPKAKLVQMLLCGATVVPVQGSYDDAFKLSLDYTARFGGLNRNTAYHPLTIEGKKTVGLEIWHQNQYRVPAAILVPTGDGVILAGVYKAFYDLLQAGLIEKPPRLICVQAETSAAIHHYWASGDYQDARNPSTIADSISVSVPSNAHLAKAAIQESGGASLTVSDREILEGQQLLAAKTGIFAEPAAAATVAALKKARGADLLDAKDQVVLLITGHGLKDVEAAANSVRLPAAIRPTPEALHELANAFQLERGTPTPCDGHRKARRDSTPRRLGHGLGLISLRNWSSALRWKGSCA